MPATEGLRVIGVLMDESGRPIPEASIEAVDATLRPCEGNTSATDTEGRFCFVAETPGPQATKLRFGGNNYFGAATRTVPLVVSPIGLDLNITLGSSRLQLSQASHQVGLSLNGEVDTEEAFEVQLYISRAGRPRTPLHAPVMASKAKPATVRLSSTKLGGPGPAELIAVALQEGKPVATQSEELLIVGAVRLAFRDVPESVRPSDGFDTSISAMDEQGPAQSGFVETRIGDVVIGMAEVRAGVAQVHSQFHPPRVESLTMTARYVPSDPFYAATSPLTTELRLLPPSPWQHLPWLVLGILATMWVIRSWRRPPSRKDAAGRVLSSEPFVGVELVEGTDDSAAAWKGVVQDAHTLLPVVGARLTLLVPSLLEREERYADTDSSGAFVLEAPHHVPEGARLQITAPDHSTLKQAAPGKGTLRIGLTARRRTLLSHLAAWAGQMGRPWEQGTRTTPANIAAIAKRSGQSAVEHWASEVEQAAYGATNPSETREQQVLQLAPPLDRPDPLRR